MSKPVRTTISLPEELYKRALEKQGSLHFSTFSDYIQHLLREEFVLREQREAAARDDQDRPPIKYPRPRKATAGKN